MVLNPLLPRLQDRVSVFHSRIVVAERRGNQEKIARIDEDFIRFLANVGRRHGIEYGSYCMSLLPKQSDRLSRLARAARRIRHEPNVDRYFGEVWAALMPDQPRPALRKEAGAE